MTAEQRNEFLKARREKRAAQLRRQRSLRVVKVTSLAPILYTVKSILEAVRSFHDLLVRLVHVKSCTLMVHRFV